MSEFTSQPFPVTRWSLIERARGAGHTDPISRQALDELLRRYLPALKTHLLLSRRLDPDRADETLQGFVASRIVENGLLSRVGPGRGRFRTYLLHAMNNFLVDQLRAERAQKRSAGDVHSLDQLGDIDQDPPDTAPAPPHAFDLAWARSVIDQAAELMQARCVHEGRIDIWEVFAARVLEPTLRGAEPIPYEQLVDRFGYRTPEQAANVLTTAKRAFQRALRTVVADYCDESEVEQELNDLRAMVASQQQGGI